MHSFTYYTPTKVFFGKDALDRLTEAIAPYAPEKVMIVYGGGSVKKNGTLDKVEAALTGSNINYLEYGGAKPNPTLDHAYEGVRLGKENHVDFILALGGGSAIDTAKAIAHGVANSDLDIWDIWTGKSKLTQTLPLGCILTIPAAGSEMSNSAVLTNESIGSKRGLTSDLNRPKFAIMDPTLTFTLPKYQIACGVTDIMMHTMDRYFNPLDNELSDSIAEALLRTVIKYGSIGTNEPDNYEAMSEIMWAGSLSHNDLTGLGGKKDFAPHQLGHELSARFDVAHGASLATVWASWARYVYEEKPSRFARFARNVWGIVEADDNAAALDGIKKTEEYFHSLGMPTCFSEIIGVQEESVLDEMAVGCTRQGTRKIGSFKVLDYDDILAIYKEADH